MNDIAPATHNWTSGGFKLEPCANILNGKKCGRQTTGRVKPAGKGKDKPLCSDCAHMKGF